MNTAPHDPIQRDGVPRPRHIRASAAGYTLIEMLTVLVLIGVMLGIASTNYSAYLDRTVPERAAGVVGSYISLTRSYAVQRRSAVTLVIDPVALELTIRDATETIRAVQFGPSSEFDLTSLDSNIPGDSLTFNAKGMCSVCGVGGNGITITARRRSFFVAMSALGRWKTSAVE